MNGRKRFLSRAARGRVTLLELGFVTLFFALSSVIIVRLYIAANDMRNLSGATARASAAAQDWADRLYAAADMKACLLAGGWEKQEDGAYALHEAEYSLVCDALSTDARAEGTLQSCRMTAARRGETLFSLPVTRFKASGAGRDAP